MSHKIVLFLVYYIVNMVILTPKSQRLSKFRNVLPDTAGPLSNN